MISTLIDKLDSFEIIRDEIAAILAAETASQQALAVTASKDPEPWKFQVYAERGNPWEKWTNDLADRSPIVNVWFDSSTYDGKASNVVERQKAEGVFNVDCYALGVAHEDGAGHAPGDEAAARNVQATARLVRNILMSSEYIYLNLRGVVWKRFPQSLTVFQPQGTERASIQVLGARFALSVHFNETSPQYVGENLELISTQVQRAADGALYFDADFVVP